MKNFFLGMLALYFLLNSMVVCYALITEWKDIVRLRDRKRKVILIILSMFFAGVPIAIKHRDAFYSLQEYQDKRTATQDKRTVAQQRELERLEKAQKSRKPLKS